MDSFINQLRRYGPTAKPRSWTLAEARSYCARLTRTHYENFSVASCLLPRRLVPHFYPVYAYCRWADDLGDETAGGAEALALLSWWREELSQCYNGTPTHPVMIALQPTIQQFQIPATPFLNLLIAFEQDQTIKQYATFEQLLDYCKNSANPVGHLVLYLCQAFDSETARLSDFTCSALQLANFWQDVQRDWLNLQRIYLPMEDLHRFGYDLEDLKQLRFTPAFRELLRFEVDRTKRMFQQGQALFDWLPADVRIDIELFWRGGMAILRKIEAQDYNVLTTRPKLAKWEKAQLIGSALWQRLRTSINV